MKLNLTFEEIEKLPLMLHDLKVLWGLNQFIMLDFLSLHLVGRESISASGMSDCIRRSNAIMIDLNNLTKYLGIEGEKEEIEIFAKVIDWINLDCLKTWRDE